MKILYQMVLAGVAVLLIATIIQSVKIKNCVNIGNDNIQPWQHILPNARFKVLFAGDSTGVGTGLSDNIYSTAGLMGRDFPDIGLENYSQNGLRLKGLEAKLKGLQGQRFDLAVFQIGANDIIFWTPMGEIQGTLGRVLDLARPIARKILILHSGDIGESPLFIPPFSWMYTWRSLKVRHIYAARQDSQVAYLDIYALNKGQSYIDCYARDSLHLNKKGYAIWYGFIKTRLEQLHWLPEGRQK